MYMYICDISTTASAIKSHSCLTFWRRATKLHRAQYNGEQMINDKMNYFVVAVLLV